MNSVDKELLGKYFHDCGFGVLNGYYDARLPLHWDISILDNISDTLGLSYICNEKTNFFLQLRQALVSGSPSQIS